MTDNNDTIAVQQTRFKGRHNVMLAFKNNRRRFNHLVFYRYGRGLHNRTAQVTANTFVPP